MIHDETTSRANPDEEPKPQGGEDRLLVAQPAVAATASEKHAAKRKTKAKKKPLDNMRFHT
jgi:hypothetical protein